MRYRAAIGALTTVWLLMAVDATAAFASGADALSDATLHDVYFADSRRGWAVGDRGTLLVTENGGRRWHVQRTGVTCTLWAIDFVTAEQGMILGGGSLPLTHESRGLILKTLDGGTNWRPVPALDLPALRGGECSTANEESCSDKLPQSTRPVWPARSTVD